MGLRTWLGLKRKPNTDNNDLAQWKGLKLRASGMLPPAVYREIFLTAFNGPDLDILEIGGAAGAASIALALGIKESGKQSKVIVVEKLEGGSRARFGDYATNLSIIERNFRAFGVEDTVRLFPHRVTWENGEAVKELIKTVHIGALLLDADGHLDRDFSLFWPLLVPGGSIIIDDYRDDPSKFTAASEGKPAGGMKLVLAFRLANYLIQSGLITVNKQIGSTLFCLKPAAADINSLNREECERIRNGVRQDLEIALERRTAQ
jgi:predicted O-methyltransferase YrrM